MATEEHRSIFVDPRAERGLMNAAIRCGRSELATKPPSVSPSDVCITVIRNRAVENDLPGAKSVFKAALMSSVEIISFLHNALLDVCAE